MRPSVDHDDHRRQCLYRRRCGPGDQEVIDEILRQVEPYVV
jgi:hypothetical protein